MGYETRQPQRQTPNAKIEMLFNQAKLIAEATLEERIIEARARELEQAADEAGRGHMARWLRQRARAVRQSLPA